eukprot:1157111-Pelagomonas_calceolata.AAC.6
MLQGTKNLGEASTDEEAGTKTLTHPALLTQAAQAAAAAAKMDRYMLACWCFHLEQHLLSVAAAAQLDMLARKGMHANLGLVMREMTVP